jgi:hypothetical protein
MRRSDSSHQIGSGKEPRHLYQCLVNKGERRGEEHIPSIGSKIKCTRFNPFVHRRVDWSKSQSEKGPSIFKEDRWHNIHNFESLWTRRD